MFRSLHRIATRRIAVRRTRAVRAAPLTAPVVAAASSSAVARRSLHTISASARRSDRYLPPSHHSYRQLTSTAHGIQCEAGPFSIRLHVPKSVGAGGAAGAAGGSTSVDYHNFWLRHNCDCQSHPTTRPDGCRHASTGERTVEPLDLDPSVHATAIQIVAAPATATATAGAAGATSVFGPSAPAFQLHVKWSDGHSSSYSSQWLSSFTPPESTHRTSPVIATLPAAGSSAAEVAAHAAAAQKGVSDADHLIKCVNTKLGLKVGRTPVAPKDATPSAAAGAGAGAGAASGAGASAGFSSGGLKVERVSVDWNNRDRALWLRHLKEDGVLVVRNAPRTPDDTLRIVNERFSAKLIPTHFGLIEDLRVNNTTNKNNDQLGYTNSAVRLHTDQPFIAVPPTMQMLHCIEPAEGGGGSSVICDASAVVKHMREHYPRELYDALTSVPVHFHRRQKNFQSLCVEPIVRVDANHNVLQVRCSYFTIDPLHGAGAPYDVIPVWYTAYNVFTALARSKHFSYYFDLRSGDFLVYDNYRMMHARTAFSGTRRFLRGIYLDKAEVYRFLSE